MQASLRLAGLVLFCLFAMSDPALALDPGIFQIQTSKDNFQLVLKLEEVALPDGGRKLLLRTSADGKTEPYVVPSERLNDAFRVLGTSSPQHGDEWMVGRTWDPRKGGPDRSILGDAPARASIVLTVSPDRSLENVSLRMHMNAFGPVYEKYAGRLQVDTSYDSKFFRVTPALSPFRQRVPGKELETYSAVALKVAFSGSNWIVPMEELEGGGYRAVGTDPVFRHIPPGSLRYLNEQEAKDVYFEYAKRSQDPHFKPQLKAIVEELFSFEDFYNRPPKSPTPLTLLQRCGRFLQSLRGGRPSN